MAVMDIRRGIVATALIGAALAVSGCTYERSGPPLKHYTSFQTEPPRKNTITVCHAYGCQKQTRVVFKRSDLQSIIDIMEKTKKDDSPAEERRAVAYAIGWIERYVGDKIGTSADRPGMDFRASGDPTQQDCVDEATNTTSYLLYMQDKGLLKHHTVQIPFSKGNIFKGVKNWPHWTAVLAEKGSGQRYAVDSWIYKNGENPAVVKAEEWYIKDLDSLPAPTT